MVEIRVERKPPRIWPWLLGVVALVLVVWLLLGVLSPDERPAAAETEQVGQLDE